MSNKEDMCGIGACRPKAMARCGSINWFTACYSVSSVLTSSLSLYIFSQVTTIERQFDLSSTQSGLLMAFNDIGYSTSIVIASYIASRVHIPKVLYMSCMLYGVSGILCAIPHFFTNNNPDGTAMSITPNFSRNLCTDESEAQSVYSTVANATASAFTGSDQTGSNLAVSLIAIGMFLQGVGKAPRYPMVSQYLDDNTKLRQTGFYMGIIQCITVFGPALAYGLGGFFSQIYVTLQDVDLHPMDPRWIGAWWLGFLFFGAATIIFTTPLVFFPRRILVNPDVSKKAASEQSGQESNCAKIIREVKGLVRSVHSVVRIPLYLLIVLASVCNLLSMASVLTFAPKYMENQFNVPAWKSNIVIAACGMPAVCFGIFVGGLLTKRLNLNPPRCLLIILAAQVVSVAFTFAAMFLKCDQPVITNWAPSLDGTAGAPSTCSNSCTCDDNLFLPVCGSDGKNYFSPCHAGCTNGTLQEFINCTCIPEGEAKTGLCEYDCNLFWIYNVINFLGYVIFAFSYIPTYVFTLRIVPNEVKSMGVGLSALAVSLFAWIPGPVIGGKLVDRACILWKMVGDDRGSCSLYDLDTLRYNLFGFNIGCKSLAVVAMALALCMAWNIRKWPNEKFLEVNVQFKVNQTNTGKEKPEADILLKYRYSERR